MSRKEVRGSKEGGRDGWTVLLILYYYFDDDMRRKRRRRRRRMVDFTFAIEFYNDTNQWKINIKGYRFFSLLLFCLLRLFFSSSYFLIWLYIYIYSFKCVHDGFYCMHLKEIHSEYAACICARQIEIFELGVCCGVQSYSITESIAYIVFFHLIRIWNF